jgi:hypothetical protein
MKAGLSRSFKHRDKLIRHQHILENLRPANVQVLRRKRA